MFLIHCYAIGRERVSHKIINSIEYQYIVSAQVRPLKPADGVDCPIDFFLVLCTDSAISGLLTILNNNIIISSMGGTRAENSSDK